MRLYGKEDHLIVSVTLLMTINRFKGFKIQVDEQVELFLSVTAGVF